MEYVGFVSEKSLFGGKVGQRLTQFATNSIKSRDLLAVDLPAISDVCTAHFYIFQKSWLTYSLYG